MSVMLNKGNEEKVDVRSDNYSITPLQEGDELRSSSPEHQANVEDQIKKNSRRSKLSIACFIISALLMGYFVYTGINTINTINDYYSTYNMKAGFGETLSYILQNGLTPLVSSIIVFIEGCNMTKLDKIQNCIVN